MAEKVAKVGIRMQPGYLYFIDTQGDIARLGKNGQREKVAKVGIKRQDGHRYFVDQQGDISRTKGKEGKQPVFANNPLSQMEWEKELLEREEREALEAEREEIEEEERERLRQQRLRSEVRKKLLEEEFKDLVKEGRERIPEETRYEVWRRDGGKCARCGSRENLEFDHVIPLSKGGSNTVRNVELLCERCNREKSDDI